MGKFRPLPINGFSPTVDTHFGDPGLFLHPQHDRGLTPREAASIQGFRDDFLLPSQRSRAFRMIGNAVPPPMGSANCQFHPPRDFIGALMNIRLSRLLTDWALRDDGSDDHALLFDQTAIHYFGRKIFDDYEPSQFDQFVDRLDRWLHNVSNKDDQQTLFFLLNQIFFVGRPEFESLCRTAYNGQVFRWLVEDIALDIADPAAMSALDTAVARTWFCPITDSMRINSFLKANKLDGKTHRPDWRSLRQFADPKKIIKYINSNNIDRLVLLEDFVGSGTQMGSAITFAANISAAFEILVVPLVTCPAGDETGHSLAAKYNNVSYDPVLVIPSGLAYQA